MGRAKVKMERLENKNKRQTTYSKRRTGILKKAKELSILCDIDVALILFSHNGKPTIYLGEHSNIDDMVAKFAQQSSQDRAERKLKALKKLKDTFAELDHNVNIEDYFGVSEEIKALCEESKTLHIQLKEKSQKFRHDWKHIASITDLDQLNSMKNSLENSLYQIYLQKYKYGMHIPLMIPQNEISQQMSRQLGKDLGQSFLSENMEQLPQRNIDCFVDNSITPRNNFPPYLNTEGQMDMGTQQHLDSQNGLDPNAYLGLILEEFP